MLHSALRVKETEEGKVSVIRESIIQLRSELHFAIHTQPPGVTLGRSVGRGRGRQVHCGTVAAVRTVEGAVSQTGTSRVGRQGRVPGRACGAGAAGPGFVCARILAEGCAADRSKGMWCFLCLWLPALS